MTVLRGWDAADEIISLHRREHSLVKASLVQVIPRLLEALEDQTLKYADVGFGYYASRTMQEKSLRNLKLSPNYLKL